MFNYLVKRISMRPVQNNAGQAFVKHKAGMALAGLLVILMTILLVLPSAAYASEIEAINLAFTSDVHGRTDFLDTWLSGLKNSTPVIDRMIFGGDYPDRMMDDTSPVIAQQCVDIVHEKYGDDTPCVLVRGNHDTMLKNYNKGLVYNGRDYAVYVMDTSSWSFPLPDIADLTEKLEDIDVFKPVYVASHCPIHYFSSRSTPNADTLLNVLNQHENVIFLWGHNHTIRDPYYGSVMTKGFRIKTTSSGEEQPINFTYLAYGAMLNGNENNNAYGLLATQTKDEDGTLIDFSYRDLSGEHVSGGSISIEGEEEDGDISKVTLTGIDVPKTGETPDTTATSYSDKYELSEVSWTPCGNPFVENTAYTACVTLTAVGGRVFAPDVVATINGNDASITHNGDGTLTVAYTFPETIAPPEISYQLTDSLAAGEIYVIVAESDDTNYALTNAAAAGDYLAGTPVTVEDNMVSADSVNDNMLWTAEQATYFYLRNSGGYLKRVSGMDGKLNASSEVPGQGYGEWRYNAGDNKLYTTSTSSQGSGTNVFLSYKSDSPGYFRAEYSQTSTVIKLYKLTHHTPINSVAISGIEAPVAGAIPTTAAITDDISCTAGAVSWIPEVSGRFACNTVYTACVTLTAAGGRVFDPDVVVTVNGNDATSITHNDDGTLTVTYTFPGTSASPEISYQSANELEDGEIYVIVADLGEGLNYALTNAAAGSGGNYLAGTPVTVEGDAVSMDSVTGNILWTAEEATYFILKNGGGYLKRVSGSERLNASSDVPGQGYGEWQYDAVNEKLYTTSTSSQGAGTKYYLSYKSDSPGYFRVERDETETEIRIYKQTRNIPAERCTVTFDSNGGSEVDPITCNKGSTITLPEPPTKEGFEFDGWFIDDGTFTNTFTESTEVTGDITVYAKWVEIFTVTFDSNGGSEVDPITCEKDSTITLPEPPTKEGHVFGGWFIDDETFTNAFTESTEVTADITVFAKWTAETSESGSGSGGNGGSGSNGGSGDSGGSGGNGGSGGSDDSGGSGSSGGSGGTTTITDENTPASGAYRGFLDVPEDAWYYEAVKFVTLRGLVKGISADLFGPDIEITRGMFVTILSRFEFGSDEKVPIGRSKFTDLTQDWYKNAVAWASKNKIVLGVSDTKFDPDGILTREQMATLIYRYAQYKGYDLSCDEGALDGFTDKASVSEYARTPMMWAVQHGLIKGVSKTLLAPKGKVTRALSADIFMQFVTFADRMVKG